jgi:creatinine amidohydrolase
MRPIIIALALTLETLAPFQQSSRGPQSSAQSHRLQDLTWVDAEPLLTPNTIVVVPLGAASKEHGPHLLLRNDLVLAEHLMARTAAATSVVVAPMLTYHYYPAFLDYPGSTSLSLDTARGLTLDVVRSLARYGPRRFYVLNTGISTQFPLSAAAEALAAEGILLRFTSLSTRLDEAARGLREQEGGSHADEIETSMMLHIDPKSVDMTRAVKEYSPRSTPFRLTRRRGSPGTYSETGIWGDPTRATAEKGRVLVDALVAGIVQEIEALRTASLPAVTDRPAEPAAAPQTPRDATGGADAPPRCTAGDLRAIRGIGDAFTAYWANADAERLGRLWTDSGDIVHPDGSVERTSQVITQNRADLFKRRDYRLTRHPMQIGTIRCIAAGIAIADGKWELRGLIDTNGKALPSMRGLCSMVVVRAGGTWRIAAYRYTVDPTGPTVPTLLKRPGYPGGGFD